MQQLQLTIRLKIIFSFFLLLLVVIGVFASTSYYRTINAMQAEIGKHGKHMINIFTQMASPYIFERDYQTFLDNSNKLIENSNILSVTVMDTKGKILINTGKHQWDSLKIEPFHEGSITNQEIKYREITLDGQKVMEFISPITALGKVVYLLKIGISLNNIESQAAERNREIGLISLGMIVFATLLGIFFSKLLTDPLKKLVQGTNEISSGNLDYKIKVNSSDEIGLLTDSFNKMAHTLQEELSKLKKAEGKIEKARNELEIRVDQRTADLQKEVEERILAEEKYRKLMETSPVPIVVYDMEGKTIYINPAFVQTFGWTMAELQGKKIDFVPDSELPQTLKILENLKKGKKYYAFNTRRYNKKREILDVNISYDVWRGKDGTPKGSVVILHDVTRSKQLENQLFQARKMEAIGTLSGGIAHDFNNILSGILGYSQLAEANIHNHEKAKNHIQHAIKGVGRAAELVRQILTFSRQTEFEKDTIPFYVVVKEVLQLMRSSIPSTIEIKERITSKAAVLADPIRMHQVIINLCTNAYHSMRDKGGVLTVTLNEIKITKNPRFAGRKFLPGNYLHLEVKDTGHGMDKKILEKAFDPYFTTKEVGKGTGFGLALVQAIVAEHDGYVKAYSKRGKGSSFNIYLPILTNRPDTNKAVQKEALLKRGTETIMIVDDEESIRIGTREFLEDCGYHVDSFQNGVQAFEAFEKDPYRFDLIITDMTMPKMAGDVLSVKILKIRKEIPIILCTGFSETITEDRAIELGIRKYVQKPVLNKEMAFLIREALDRDVNHVN